MVGSVCKAGGWLCLYGLLVLGEGLHESGRRATRIWEKGFKKFIKLC